MIHRKSYVFLHDSLPSLFRTLIESGNLNENDVKKTSDGFYGLTKSVAQILAVSGIDTFPGSDDRILYCDRYFDDWFIYAVPAFDDCVYGLFKLREQEHDMEEEIEADGDTPGVTISFIEFEAEYLTLCLAEPDHTNRKALGKEINRVVANPGQNHHWAIKRYFNRAEAEAPYLIAELYVRFIASLAENGSIAVPDHYAEIYHMCRSDKGARRAARLPDFIEHNNRMAGRIVCDHTQIYIGNPDELSQYEKLAILATHTGNVSYCSFAAEVKYHAYYLTAIAKVKIPYYGRSIYSSAVRADMSVDDAEFQGHAPFYRLNSRQVKSQLKYHIDSDCGFII